MSFGKPIAPSAGRALPALLVALLIGSPAPSAEPAANYRLRQHFGMNLSGVVDWTREWALIDVFKHSRPWAQKGAGEFAFNENGYPLLKPGQSVETLMVREINGHYPRGTYVVTYEGTGKVELRRYDVKKVSKEAPGRIEVEVEPGDGGLQLVVSTSEPKDPVRNIHVWMPGFENARSPFHPLFVERLQPFGVLRFMDWQKTNNSPLVKWSERAKPSDARFSTKGGVPVEQMVELANTCKAHPWFCMPHLADDDFVRQFARTVKERLDPGLKVYVEYSNEVWNGQFAQARHARDRGKELKLSDNDFQAQLRYYSQRSVAIFQIWEQVFGDRKRLVRVMASQSANPWVSEQVLSWRDAHKQVDALAVAPYFGNGFGSPKTRDEVAKLTVEQLLDALDREVKEKNRDVMQKQAELARKYQVELVAYEGGQHLAGHGGVENDQALTDLFIAANRHARMHDLYRQHLENWCRSGGGLYVVFSNVGKPSKWGSWGVLERQDQPIDQAPKYRAVVEFVQREQLRK